MAVTPADLLAPAGPVEDTLFRDEGDGSAGTELNVRLSSYISTSVAKVAGVAFPDQDTEDAAVTAWSLYLAFKAAYMVAVANPATENAQVEIIGSKGYAKDQRDALREAAEEFYRDYELILAAIPTDAQPYGVPTRSTTNKFEY